MGAWRSNPKRDHWLCLLPAEDRSCPGHRSSCCCLTQCFQLVFPTSKLHSYKWNYLSPLICPAYKNLRYTGRFTGALLPSKVNGILVNPIHVLHYCCLLPICINTFVFPSLKALLRKSLECNCFKNLIFILSYQIICNLCQVASSTHFTGILLIELIFNRKESRQTTVGCVSFGTHLSPKSSFSL